MRKKQLQRKLEPILPRLIERVKSGDSSAREELAAVLLPYVKVVIGKYQVSGDTNESLAGWIVAKLLNNIQKIDTSKSLLGFIATLARNEAIDRIRYENSAVRKLSKEDLTDYSSYAASKPNIPDTEIRFLIESCFSPLDSEIVSSFHLDNKTIQEISAATGEPEDYIVETLNGASEYLEQSLK